MNDLTLARERLVQVIGDAGSLTLADLRAQTGFSRSTLRDHLSRLNQLGVVEKTQERRRTGRPPSVYRLTPQGALRASGRYHAFLHALLAAHASRVEETESLLRDALADWTQRNAEIRNLPTVEARFDAARRLLFEGLHPHELRKSEDGDGFEFSIESCPLGAQALEYGDPCAVARALIGSLAGVEVQQAEWISRGDPRCTFRVRDASPAAPSGAKLSER